MRGTATLTAGFLAVGLALALPAAAQVKAGSESGLGLTGADVPPLLKDIKAEPYQAPTAPACLTIPFELQQINELIGADIDTPPEHQDKSLTDRGAQMARGLLPYGGVVRFVTGANKKDQELREAVLAGYARRGYLRGVQANLKCQADPPPAADPAAAAKPKGKVATRKKAG